MATAMIIRKETDELWTGKDNLEQRMSYFLGNDFLSDVTFLVGEEKKRIPGHKFIMSSCSWDFYNALHLLEIDNNELPIQDVTESAFMEFLEFCYTGKVNLTFQNVISVLKLAYRFHMTALVKICERKIGRMVGKKSCMKVFRQCLFIPGDSSLRVKLLKLIVKHFDFLFHDTSSMDNFKALPLATVNELAGLLKVWLNDKMLLFEALIQWAVANLDFATKNTPQNLRKCLGESFYKISFEGMKIEQFAEIVVKYPGIFSHEEVTTIFEQIKKIEKIKASSKKPEPVQSAQLPTASGSTALVDSEEMLISFKDSLPEELIQVSYLDKSPFKCLSCNFSIDFRISKSKTLLGFAMFVERNQVIQLQSYKLGTTNYNSCYPYLPVQVRTNKRHQFDRLYDLVLIEFTKVDHYISANKCYTLSATFKSLLPVASESVLKPTDDLELQRCKNCELIPFIYVGEQPNIIGKIKNLFEI
ncbi:BTB domain-containing protein [Sergentomyia squamirostris]